MNLFNLQYDTEISLQHYELIFAKNTLFEVHASLSKHLTVIHKSMALSSIGYVFISNLSEYFMCDNLMTVVQSNRSTAETRERLKRNG